MTLCYSIHGGSRTDFSVVIVEDTSFEILVARGCACIPVICVKIIVWQFNELTRPVSHKEAASNRCFIDASEGQRFVFFSLVKTSVLIKNNA